MQHVPVVTQSGKDVTVVEKTMSFVKLGGIRLVFFCSLD